MTVPKSHIFIFCLLISLCSTAQTTEGWVKGNIDTLIYISGIYDFNSFEIKSKTLPAELEDRDFNYYLGDVGNYSGLNGLGGLLIEWGAANAELSTHLSNYETYLKRALQKGATVDQQSAFTSENSFIRVVKSRHYFLELLKFASIYKKDIYQKNLENYSFCIAFSMCDKTTKELIELRTKKINSLVSALKINHVKASWTDGAFWIGDTGVGTFDEEMKPKLKAYQDNEIRIEVLAAAKKSAKQKASVKFVKANTTRFSSDKSKTDFFFAVSQIASPSAYAILSSELNYSTFTRYARDTSLISLFENFNTVVHETCHMVNGSDRYFISEWITIPVVSTKVYNSLELIKVIPKEKYQSFFRSTYVVDQSGISAQVSGIYGLLDEFSAYYNGAKTDWDILTNREKIIQKFPVYKEGMKELTVSTWDAYYEFSVMMAWYLDYSQQRYPNQYKLLMSNKALRVAYTLLDQRFGELVRKVEIKYGSVDRKLQELYKESMKTLNQFKVEKCTEVNYKEYLE